MNETSKKFCPLCAIKGGDGPYCNEENCAWWCEWSKCCALVAIPAEISDRMHDLTQTIER